MTKIILRVAGVPVAKGRAKHRRVKKKDGTEFVSTYTPAKTRSFENRVRDAAVDAMGIRPPLVGALAVRIRFLLEPPASTSPKRRREMLEGLWRPTKKPDLDNLEKAILDGLNAVAYRDDSLIVDKTSSKAYGSPPGAEIEIELIGPAVK